MRLILRSTYLLILLLTGAVPAVAGSLSAFGELGYGHLDGEVGGEQVEASEFFQQYSFLYEKSGEFLGGRAGRYRGALGAEWTFLDSEFDGEDLDLDTSKILYRGDLTIAPGGLPFRIHLYSQDMVRSRFSDDRREIRGLDTGFYTGIRNGKHQTTGATMIIGIRNGSYLGRYREVLSHFPRFLMDYKEEVHRDLQGSTPIHTRHRDLAFVSLNKKDNWFHYRFSDFDDYLNEEQDYNERTYMLGTVDHTLQRQWINLTNWIKVSTDGAFNTIDFEGKGEKYERFDLNFFALARRSKWEAANFSRFERGVGQKNDDLTESWRRLEVPLYLKGEFDRDTSWKFTFIGSREEETSSLVGSEIEVLYGAARVETFRQRRFVLVSEFEGELTESDGREYYNARLSGEFYSNRRYRPRIELAGRYSLTYFGGEGSRLEQTASLRAASDITSRLRTRLAQTFILSSGNGGNAPDDEGLGLKSYWDVSDGHTGGDAFKSITSWMLDHRTAGNFSNRLTLSYEYLHQEEETQEIFSARHSGRYDKNREIKFRIENQLQVGDKVHGGASSMDSLLKRGTFADDSAGETGMAFSHHSSLSYSPSSTWESGGEIEVDYEDLPGRSATTTWMAEQFSRYTFFKVNGIIRKFVELRESVKYERFYYSGGKLSGAELKLEGFYFPIRGLSLGLLSRYLRLFTSETESLENTFEAAWVFEKLALAFDYTYRADSGEDFADSESHRWRFSIRKTL